MFQKISNFFFLFQNSLNFILGKKEKQKEKSSKNLAIFFFFQNSLNFILGKQREKLQKISNFFFFQNSLNFILGKKETKKNPQKFEN
jgi:hypothetical protein